MMTSMVFLPLDWGRGPMRSTDMIFHGEDGISFGWSGVEVAEFLTLTF